MPPEIQRRVTNCVVMALIADLLSVAGTAVALSTGDRGLFMVAQDGWAKAADIYWRLAIMAMREF